MGDGLAQRGRLGLAAALMVLLVVAVPASGGIGPELPPSPPAEASSPQVASAPADIRSRPGTLESQPIGPRAMPAQSSKAGGLEGGAGTGAADRSGLWETWLKPAAALAVVLGLIAVLARGAKSMTARHGGLLAALGPGGRAPSGVLHVLGRYPVGRGQTLVLLHVAGRVLLVCQTHGRTGGGMHTVAEFTDPQQVAAIVAKTESGTRQSVLGGFSADLSCSLQQTDRDLAAMLQAPPVVPAAPIAAPIAGVSTRAYSDRPARGEREHTPQARRITSPRASDEATDGAAAAAAIRRRLAAMQSTGGTGPRGRAA